MEIKVSDLLTLEHICLDLKAMDKVGAIKEMVELLEVNGDISDKQAFVDCLLEREKLETTGIGDGVALPHGRTDAVKRMVLAFARSLQGVDYQALDGQPVHILFLLAAPKSESTKVLKLLARISRLLNNAGFRKALLEAKTKEEIQELIRQREG